MLSISAGKQVSVAMTVEKLGAEIRSDTLYKYLRQTLASKVQTVKYVGELAIYNYHRDNLTVSDSGLILYKGSRFLVPKVLRAGLLKGCILVIQGCYQWFGEQRRHSGGPT